jgi:cytochrome c oxidase subunit 2
MNRTLRRDLITISILWVVLSAVGDVFVSYAIETFPGMDSEQGIVTSDAFFFLLRISVPILILVGLMIVYAAFRFRVSDHDEVPSAHQYRSAHAFPLGWVAASVILNVLFIVHPGITGLDALWVMTANAKDATEIDVTGKQWEWRFAYPAQHLSDVDELVVPVNQPIRFVLHSDDVIHSFWIPAWGIKKDVVPGTDRTLVITPNRITDTMVDPLARTQCAQICGAGHAEMQSVVRVVSLEDFNKWVDETREASDEEMGGMKMDGMKMDGEGEGGMNMDMNMNGEGGDMKMDGQGGDMNMNMDMNDQENGNADMSGMNMQEMNGSSSEPVNPDAMPMPSDSSGTESDGSMSNMNGQMKMNGQQPAGGSD